MDSKTDKLAVTEEADVDAAIQIHLKKELITQAYKETLDIDNDNIDTYELRNKVNTIKWRPIYEVINEVYFKKPKNPPDYFMQQCKDNVNEAQFIPLKMKNNIN